VKGSKQHLHKFYFFLNCGHIFKTSAANSMAHFCNETMQHNKNYSKFFTTEAIMVFTLYQWLEGHTSACRYCPIWLQILYCNH